MKIEWHGAGRKAIVKPNPEYPDGMDFDISDGAAVTCVVQLPYPAEECGIYIVTCETCGLTGAITAAGRPDDPRSVKMACHKHKLEGDPSIDPSRI